MYKEAAPFIEPDMSNYYRLLREAAVREKVRAKYPDLQDKLDALYQRPAVASFLQAIPQKNIRPRDEFEGTVSGGGMTRGIEISNSITERKIFINRLAEASLNPQPDPAATALVEQHIMGFIEHHGLAPELAARAISETKSAMARLKMTAITGGKPALGLA